VPLGDRWLADNQSTAKERTSGVTGMLSTQLWHSLKPSHRNVMLTHVMIGYFIVGGHPVVFDEVQNGNLSVGSLYLEQVCGLSPLFHACDTSVSDSWYIYPDQVARSQTPQGLNMWVITSREINILDRILPVPPTSVIAVFT